MLLVLPGVLLLGYVGAFGIFDSWPRWVQALGCVLAMGWIMTVEFRLHQLAAEVKGNAQLSAMGSATAMGFVMQQALQSMFQKPEPDDPAADVLQVEEDEDDEELSPRAPVDVSEIGRCVGCNESVQRCAKQHDSFGKCCSLCVCVERVASAGRLG